MIYYIQGVVKEYIEISNIYFLDDLGLSLYCSFSYKYKLSEDVFWDTDTSKISEMFSVLVQVQFS